MRTLIMNIVIMLLPILMQVGHKLLQIGKLSGKVLMISAMFTSLKNYALRKQEIILNRWEEQKSFLMKYDPCVILMTGVSLTNMVSGPQKGSIHCALRLLTG